MKTLQKKLLRDIQIYRNQAGAIALVTGGGVMVLVLYLTVLDSLRDSQNMFYARSNFARIFCDLKRAPEYMAEQVKEMPGVKEMDTRIKAQARLTLEGFHDPIQAELISIPDNRQTPVNSLYLRQGSMPEPGYNRQVLINDAFARAHGLTTGSRIQATIMGGRQTLEVTGVALSAEYIFHKGPWDLLPDHRRNAVLWINKSVLSAALDIERSFNNLVLTLDKGADEKTIMEELDRILEPFGSTGAYPRHEQTSHRFLEEELGQLQTMAFILPSFFLGVSAFLLNILMARVVQSQRRQIAILKAYGYSNSSIALHYTQLTMLIVLSGSLAGIIFGAWAADATANLYAQYFRFPEMSFRLKPQIIILALFIALGAGLAGGLRSVTRAAGMPPAEAMRPPLPESFSSGPLQKGRLYSLLSFTTRISIRNLFRHRTRSIISASGIGLSGALIFLGFFQFISVNRMLDLQYGSIWLMDIQLGFDQPASGNAMAGLRNLPGVLYAEPFRSVPVRLSSNRVQYRTNILGLDKQTGLRKILTESRQPGILPETGLLLTDHLAEMLKVQPGDIIKAKILHGHRRLVDLPLAGVVAEPVGTGAYMLRSELNSIMREGPAINGVWLLMDPEYQAELQDRLNKIPAVFGTGLISRAEKNIRSYLKDTILIFMLILLALAGSITFAVAYNFTESAFSERIRELATLRALGFTRNQVLWVLAAETLFISLAAVPLGWASGMVFAVLLNGMVSTELFRLPFVPAPQAFAVSALGILTASALSIALVQIRLRKLNIVAALKTE